MAEIRPFRAWRYSRKFTADIENFTSPLFDVVSKTQRARLYENPLNSIHLSVPQGEKAANNSGKLLQSWKNDETLSRDSLPAIYVYYQYFSLPGINKTFCRKGFICNIRLYEWEDQVMLRHENTMPKAVNDRVDVLAATKLNVSATHGLYTDEEHALEQYMDESMRHPVYDIEDYQGVRDVMSVIQDRSVIEKFIEVLKSKQVILADGHHRYEGALMYKREAANDENHPANFHMMYLTNTESEDLQILPTHRLIHDLPSFAKKEVMQKLDEYFQISPIDEPHTAMEIIAGKPHTFALLMPHKGWKLKLRPELEKQIPWKFDSVVNELDITVLHYYILDRAFGIPGKTHTTSPHITFDRSFSDTLALTEREEIQAAVITNNIPMDTIKKVCYSGSIMPQKSTFFYPKVVCGFVFSTIDHEEFSKDPITCF